MDLRQLRYFVAIAAAGSLSKASATLRVAQPALSLQLANLEADVGARLFDRSSRGVTLTPSGTILLQRAETILKEVNDARQAVQRKSDDIEGEVSVGFPTTVAAAFVAAFLARARAELPGIRLSISEHTTAHLGDLLHDGKLDLAVLMNAPTHASVSMQPLLLESYCLVSRSDHPCTEKTIPWVEATALPLLLPSAANILRIMIEEAALHAGRQLDIKAELNSARLLMAGVRAGIGHAILPRSYLFPEEVSGETVVRLIVDPEIRSLLQLASSSIRPMMPAQLAARELLIRLIRDFVVERDWKAELHWSLA